MNREIKFRGKRVDNGQWVYGGLVQHSGRTEILVAHSQNLLDYDLNVVQPETVGQYTGLKDNDGKEIYEGDFVQHISWDYPFEVIFDDEKARFVCKMKSSLTQFIDHKNISIVGNIHDNPELIKQQQNKLERYE